MLACYRLALPSDRMWSEGYSFDDFFSSSAISLPLTSNSEPTTFPSAHIEDDNHEWPDHTSILDIDPRAFVVPADARCRFARLISAYDLQVDHRNKAVLGAGFQDAHQSLEVSHEKGAAGASSEAAPKRWTVDEARWMLCSQMGSCEQAMES